MEGTIMKKNIYIKPSMSEFVFQQQSALLAGSDIVKAIPDNNPEKFVLDPDNLDDEDILR
jgi:hypothetical protein